MKGIIAACGVGAYAMSAHGQGVPVQHSVREGYLYTSDSARIFYRIAGQTGDTLIAIHGGPGVDLESIVADFAPLAKRHVVIFYDQRGAGRSELPTDTLRLLAPRQIQDLDDVRRHFALDRASLVAHSYGPLLAASYALAHPDHVLTPYCSHNLVLYFFRKAVRASKGRRSASVPVLVRKLYMWPFIDV